MACHFNTTPEFQSASNSNYTELNYYVAWKYMKSSVCSLQTGLSVNSGRRDVIYCDFCKLTFQ